MPDFVKQALIECNLLEAYENRPPYQLNDYIGWILSAKREETQQKRILQMLEELSHGGIYMKMKHTPSESGEKSYDWLRLTFNFKPMGQSSNMTRPVVNRRT